MRYSKSMIEAVRQVAMYEQFDYVLLDKDNKIIARYKGRDAKKHAEINKKGAERKLGVKKPIKVYPINPGDKKKFKVYVKNDKGNVVKVEYGDPNMEIKRDDPGRRANFRARHNCDNPGPKYKARYWSCKFWSAKSVSDLMKG